MSTQVAASPRRTRRRDFLTVGAAVAAVVASMKASTVADAVADPLPSLVARRNEIVDWVNARSAGSDAEPEAYAELNALEKRIFKSFATTRDRLVAQLRFVRRFIDEGFDFDDDCGHLIDNVISALGKMGVAARTRPIFLLGAGRMTATPSCSRSLPNTTG